MSQNPIGEIVKKLRKKNAWSQEEFAGISGIATRTIQRVESGEKANTDTLKAIAAAIKMDVTELLPLNEPIPVEDMAKAEAQVRQQFEQIEKELNVLPRIFNGKELLTVVSSFHLLNTHHPSPTSKEEGNAVASLLQLVRDYGDVHGELGPIEEMEMVFEVEGHLKELEQFGLLVFAGKLRGSVVFGALDSKGQPTRMAQGAVFVCRADEIKTFTDPNNGDKESARFRVPYGPVKLC